MALLYWKEMDAPKEFTPYWLHQIMSDTNGYSNGLSNGGPNNSDPVGQHWRVGLLNSQCRYLTAESFGYKVNANGLGLKKKQLWTLEPFGDDDSVCLRSHLDRYLSVDHFGNVTCENEEKTEGAKFFVAVANDGTGRWALRNSVRGYFLGAANDKLLCSAKVPGPAELWTVHLAARPQVNIRSVGRRRYARLAADHEAIHVDANTPWGEDTLFTLEFHDGRYAIHTCNDKYLRFDGSLSEGGLCPETLFTLEFHSGYLALRDSAGRYVAPLGSRALLKTRSQTVTKDELFFLEDSVPQAAFVAFNGKYVSVKQGVDVTANQDEVSDHEIFQLEYDIPSKKWRVRTMQDMYWSLQSSSGIQANADKGTTNSLFSLEWADDGSVSFVAANGKCVVAKKSGHLYANGGQQQDEARFYFYLVNRPSLVLKCEQGFVGYKSNSNPKLECNKAAYETIVVERDEKGLCFFKGSNGKYWNVCEDGTITVDSDVRHGFFIELREPSKLCIKTSHGSYVMAEKNGTFKVNGASYDTATWWEY